jgi:hypothetical protein
MYTHVEHVYTHVQAGRLGQRPSHLGKNALFTSVSEVRKPEMAVEVGVGGDGIDAVIHSPWWQPVCYGDR